ncbi:DUF2997 domain-containing protein [Planctomyces sp. SH-PL14]|uniref:DUF2997 domain-containing protein n=1 Tax=Planctomyces sp. SH-PL14 TaxID=1632864 RepID=UPI00078BB3DD|nr:DUF2997 domain-containing protein [Planctomyces sp. SH-PL14]AMV20170.1 hypothetical protein VT03_19900 [Planctomyces sp. SH-PL14]
MKTIEITVTPNGQTQVETKGFEGSSCRQASEFLERALGRTTDERLTPDFYATQYQSHHTETKA